MPPSKDREGRRATMNLRSGTIPHGPPGNARGAPAATPRNSRMKASQPVPQAPWRSYPALVASRERAPVDTLVGRTTGRRRHGRRISSPNGLPCSQGPLYTSLVDGLRTLDHDGAKNRTPVAPLSADGEARIAAGRWAGSATRRLERQLHDEHRTRSQAALDRNRSAEGVDHLPARSRGRARSPRRDERRRARSARRSWASRPRRCPTP